MAENWIAIKAGEVMAMRQRPAPYNHQARVDAFFDALQTSLGSAESMPVWFQALKAHALAKDRGWKIRAQSCLDILAQCAGATSVNEQRLQELLDECQDSEPGAADFVVPVTAIAAVAVTTWSGLYIKLDWGMVLPLVLAMMVVGVWWARTRTWLQPKLNPRLSPREPLLVMAACALLLPLLMFSVPLLVGEFMQIRSTARFDAARSEFMTDPRGFPVLKAFARDHYGVLVMLGDSVDSWASTSLALPGASAASLRLGAGYCELGINPENVARSPSMASTTDSILWLQGVMMHELSHCLENSGDIPRQAGAELHTRSIAPPDRSGVTDLESLLLSAKKPTTVLWREAMADAFAVGYWRMSVPGLAGNLTAALRAKRAEAANLDTTHATMCWIDQASKAPLPAGNEDLLRWADQVRREAPCSLSIPQREPPAFINWVWRLGDWLGRLQRGEAAPA